jgi:hypothetical protein
MYRLYGHLILLITKYFKDNILYIAMYKTDITHCWNIPTNQNHRLENNMPKSFSKKKN